MIDDLKSELSGNFERVIVGLMTPTTMYDVHELRRALKVWKSFFMSHDLWSIQYAVG